MACTNNVLQNGDFASNSFASWSFTNNGTATASASTGAAVVNVTTGGTNTRLSQNGFSLVAGQTYTVEFTASSTAAASMQVRAIQHASPNTFAGLNETVALTTTPQT